MSLFDVVNLMVCLSFVLVVLDFNNDCDVEPCQNGATCTDLQVGHLSCHQCLCLTSFGLSTWLALHFVEMGKSSLFVMCL